MTEPLSDLVPIHQEGDQLWVDARTLHASLQVGRDFSNWIRGRLEESGATEGEEFVVLDGSPVLASGFNPTPRRDYWLSIDLSKELAMLERSPTGKKIRRYFIEAEKRYRQQVLALPNFSDPVAAARAWANEMEGKRQALAAQAQAEEQVALLAPKAEQFQALMATEGSYSVSDAAKLLGTGERRLFQLLRDRQILMDANRSGAEHHNIPYQKYLDAGYFDVITRPRPDGKAVTYTPRITPKGLAWLDRKMREEKLLPMPPALPPGSGAQA
ncbi:phage antirepressor KilAC domain-containing protein [Deinococcus sp. QL22]|uniref:phage antirepressor KilAC domain-containing protein n=1 Tax=Deinococcus sp. QL22 TaxID=2939437 RepID=UPI0020182AB6|nr:phage antirepressor KilAC domain-containing protein [Deinococcus sp. QL22]UQN10408.1 phage antirepressor KilAC domain-containing protein [Deinococcus sp. QL22]UQN10542.1 phage antirepressor KilAC domain-containing protein [Deinococcus sp. QL22]